VIGIARRRAELEDPRYRHLQLDLSDLGSVKTRLDSEVGRIIRGTPWQRVGLVNNAASPDLLGPLEQLDPDALQRLYAINVVAPVWLMGFVIRSSGAAAKLRIVNVSSGAATRPFPGLAAYGSSKAALRMAGMVLGAELDSPQRTGLAPLDAAIVSYEPGVVETPMQQFARSQPVERFPWVTIFQGFKEQGVAVPPEVPAGEIAGLLEADGLPHFLERRLGS
jgi:benzil reductase ((S)-benzoin forming)